MTDDGQQQQRQAAPATTTTAPSSSSQPDAVSSTTSGTGTGGEGRGSGGGSNGGRGRSSNGGGRGGNQQQRSSGGRNTGGRGRGGGGRGRGSSSDGPSPSGPSSQQQQQQRQQGVTVAPTTGIPFGHVPAYLPGSSSLVEDLDQRIMVVLRDGRHLLGTFRSFDQFSNMVLDDACERKLHFDVSDGVTYYADIPLGLYIVRGDSVVLLGQIGDDGDGTSDEVHPLMKMIDLDELEGKIASASSNKNKASSSPEGVDNGHVLEWDFDKDLLA